MRRKFVNLIGTAAPILGLVIFTTYPALASEKFSAGEKDSEALQSDAAETEIAPKSQQQLELERLKAKLEEIKAAEALKTVSDIDVELIQRALNALGFEAGVVDNKLGSSTQSAISRFQTSLALEGGAVTGKLTPQQTVKLFEAAANADHAMSQYVYGIMHLRGIGVEQNGSEAVTWLIKASEKNLAIASYALGVIYRDGIDGRNGVSPDNELSQRYFEQSGDSYQDGNFGVDFPIVEHPDNNKL